MALGEAEHMRYIRLLERDNNNWTRYIPQLAKHNKPFLVYSWKSEQSGAPTRAFTLLVSFELETRYVQRSSIILTTAIVSYLFLTLPQWLLVAPLAYAAYPYILQLLSVIGAIGALAVTGMLGNILWDLIKYSYQKLRSRNNNA
jgi:hypothetical protein